MVQEQTPNPAELAQVARCAEGFLAGPLFRFQEEHLLSDEQLARVVGCPAEKLSCLALCTVPKSVEDVAVIATYVDGDLNKLTAWLKTVVYTHSSPLKAEREDEPYVVDEVYERGEQEVLGLNGEEEEASPSSPAESTIGVHAVSARTRDTL